jgi:2-dehydro-3-deoxyphosphooctonate aldolase (KDO 8-P synthase)
VVAAAKSGKIVNVKKGQFLAPWDVINIMEKIKESGNHRFFITERGTSFGYNRLVVDFTGMLFLMRNNIPLIFDVTHSMQTPGSGGTTTGGNRQYVEHISYAGAALGEGLKGMFFEIHPEPDKALSDAGNSYYSDKFETLVERVIKVRNLVKRFESEK